MTVEEIAIRRPVWVATSNLFLDTDVRLWYASVARTLAESPFTSEQLETMFMAEVAPVVEVNLLSPSGESARFDEEWLVSRIVARLEQKVRLPSFIARSRWQSIVPLVESLRKTEQEDWPKRVAVWEQMSKLFLDRKCDLAAFEGGWTAAALDGIWRNEVWPTYGRSVKAYRKQNPDAYPSEEEIAIGWARIRNAMS